MNICIISPGYPYVDNMRYVFVKKLVDEWTRQGHRCVVFCPFSLTSYLRKIIKYVPKYYKDENNPDNPVEVFHIRYFSIPKTVLLGVEINNAIISRKIYRLAKSKGINPDIIYCHFFSSAVFGWYLSNHLHVPLFVASGESTIGRVYPPTRTFSLERFRNDIRGCICVSSKNKEEAIRKHYIDEDKCVVIPNGTDLSIFKRIDKYECRKKLNFQQNYFIVVCVGGFIERKGQNRIIEAIKKLGNSNIKLVLIGDGNLSLEHESIIFKGRVNNTDLPMYLNSSDVFCLPTYAEGCCNAIIEAMACGLPIVSSDLPFNYDVLNSQSALLVNPSDIKAIADAIYLLMQNEELRKELSEASVARVKLLSIKQRAENVMSFIESKL